MDRRHLHYRIPALLLVVLLTACPANESPGTNRAPTAAAGADRNVAVGALVTLDAGASTDANGDQLSFVWAIETVPAGSGAALSTADSAVASFTADLPGNYVVALSVSDGQASDGDEITVTALAANGAAPTIAPIADQRAPRGEVIEVPVTITDEDPATVVVFASSSDTTLIADTDLAMTGSGSERTLRITLAQPGSGSAVVTLVATDADALTGSAKFTITVTQPFATELPKLTASDAAGGDEFGYAVAMSGNLAIIGASLDDDNGFNSGSAYLFRRSADGWAQSMKLPVKPPVVAPTAVDEFYEFGYAVAISSDYIVVGAPGDGDTTFEGAAYVYELCPDRFCQEPATEMAELQAGDAAPGDAFGSAVAVNGEHALIAARLSDGDGTSSGSVYAFRRNGDAWVETAELTASDARIGDVFGRSVAMSGEFAVIGSPSDDDVASDSGAAYIFQRSGDTWTQMAKLKADDPFTGDLFGWSVALAGDFAIAGAPNGNGGAGAAYVFQRSGDDWLQVDELTAGDAADDDAFGFIVALEGDDAIVGAPFDVHGGIRAGSAYVFHHQGGSWTEVNKLTASDAAADDDFGRSVAVASGHALIGARSSDDDGTESGSVYAFSR